MTVLLPEDERIKAERSKKLFELLPLLKQDSTVMSAAQEYKKTDDIYRAGKTIFDVMSPQERELVEKRARAVDQAGAPLVTAVSNAITQNSELRQKMENIIKWENDLRKSETATNMDMQVTHLKNLLVEDMRKSSPQPQAGVNQPQIPNRVEFKAR